QPKVAVLKPVSSAISIGSGGPFGAEGPIIMTGGAFGSIIAQLCHLEKIARRGYHVSREYSVDPLELLSVGDIMTTGVVTVQASQPVREVLREYFQNAANHKHQAYPVVDADGKLL